MWPRNYSTIVWVIIATISLIYPHVAYLRCRRSINSKNAELNNLLIDAFLVGFWVAVLAFPLWISFLCLSATAMNIATNRGLRGVMEATIAAFLGGMAAIIFWGFNYSPETDGLVMVLCIFANFVYVIVVANLIFTANKQLSQARKMQQQNESDLLQSNTALLASNQSIETAKKDAMVAATKLQTILNAAPVGICLLNENSRHTQVNAKYLQMTGYTEHELLGHTVSRLMPSFDDFKTFVERVALAVRAGRTYSEELIFVSKDGSKKWIRSHVEAMVPFEVDKGLVVACEDITERVNNELSARVAELERTNQQLETVVAQRTAELVEQNRKLEVLSTSDPLTGISNRLRLDHVLEEELARSSRSGANFSVILLDLDHFKSVNDLHGHQTGDRVLVALAGKLQEGIRELDVVGRWGGEEFLVICRGTDLPGAVTLAEKLRGIIASHVFPVVGAKTGSFGVASHHAAETIDALIARADSALYQAKLKGRNLVVW